MQKGLLHAPSPARELSTELASRPRRAVGRSSHQDERQARPTHRAARLEPRHARPTAPLASRPELSAHMRARSPSAARDWAVAVAVGVGGAYTRPLPGGEGNLARTSTINAQACSSTLSPQKPSPSIESAFFCGFRPCAVFRLLPVAKNNMFQASPAGDFGAWGVGLTNLGGAAISRKLAYNFIAHLLSLALK